jgi:RNA polymerase sigma-70 factor, ECF subfamily
MTSTSLADVIARAQGRDPAAFDTLVELYAGRLYGYFYRLTGSRHDADDLLQELFVRLVRVIPDYEDDGRFDGWIFRIATNLVRDRVRRSRKNRAAGISPASGAGPDDPDLLATVADPAAKDPGGRLEHIEQCDRLQWAISQLPEGEREVILLRHFSQLSFREIADQMGTPLGTALARAHRGLAHLRELVERPENDGGAAGGRSGGKR